MLMLLLKGASRVCGSETDEARAKLVDSDVDAGDTIMIMMMNNIQYYLQKIKAIKEEKRNEMIFHRTLEILKMMMMLMMEIWTIFCCENNLHLVYWNYFIFFQSLQYLLELLSFRLCTRWWWSIWNRPIFCSSEQKWQPNETDRRGKLLQC